jgi:membrane protein
MVIKGYNVWPLLKKTGREIGDDRIPALAAETAYYFFFSLFPLLLFLAPLLSLVGDKREMMNWLMSQIEATVPAEAVAMLKSVVANVVFSPNAPGLMSVGLVLAAWSGSNIFGSLMDALNLAYGVKETRPWWKRQLIRLAALVVAGGVLLLVTVIMLGGEDIVRAVADFVHLGSTARVAWLVIEFPLAFAFLVGCAWLIYYMLPNVHQSKPQVLVGALVASLLWVLATLAFRWYVQHFGSYNKTYGTIGGVIVLMTWMYYSMFVLLAAGELCSELQKATGRTTSEKGASYFGRIATGAPTGTASTDAVEPAQPLRARRT